jgi:hypothetical protein
LASFALSAAMTPSIAPLPNSSGWRELCFAWAYAMKPATAPPVPGTIPMTTPRIEARSNSHL